MYVKPQFDDPSKKPSRCDWHSGQIQKSQSGLYKPYRVCIKITSSLTHDLVGKGDVKALHMFYYVFVNPSPLNTRRHFWSNNNQLTNQPQPTNQPTTTN